MDGGDAMNKAFLCVLIAGLLPYVGTMAAKWGFRRFDNNNPREWLAQQTGFRARANAAALTVARDGRGGDCAPVPLRGCALPAKMN